MVRGPWSRAFCRSPAKDVPFVEFSGQIERAARRLHYLRQSGLFILFAGNLIMRIPERIEDQKPALPRSLEAPTLFNHLR